MLVGVGFLVRVRFLIRVREVVEHHGIELFEPFRGVGLLVDVRGGSPAEPFPGLILSPRVQERVGVGVEQPAGLPTDPAVGQLGHLQRDHGRLGQPLIRRIPDSTIRSSIAVARSTPRDCGPVTSSSARSGRPSARSQSAIIGR